MNCWKKRYFEAFKFLREIKDVNLSVLLAFNVNIDKIIKLDSNILEKIFLDTKTPLCNLKTVFPDIIETRSSLIQALICSIKSGIGAERLISTRELCNWIETVFPIEKAQIGGQAGIMANILANFFNLEDIVLHIPIISKEFIPLLNEKVKIPIDKRKTKNIKQINENHLKTNENIPIHYIFEFKRGQYILGKKRILCPKENRFIASYDVVNSRMILNPAFIKYSLANAKKFDLAIVSGLHLVEEGLHEQTISQMLKPVIELILKWKKKNPRIKIHVELASMSNLDLIRYIITNIFPKIDSIGLNDMELELVLKAIEKSINKPTNNKDRLKKQYLGIKTLWDQYPNLRIHLHRPSYYMIVSKKITDIKARLRTKALILAAVGAAIKAKVGALTRIERDLKNIFTFQDMIELKVLEDYLKDIKFVGNISKNGYMHNNTISLNCIPTILVKNPIQLVGLGDTISLLALIFEEIFKV